MFVKGNLQEVIDKLLTQIVQLIETNIVEKGSCHIVFPGGRSAQPVFEQLKRQTLPWSKLHFYPTDERCVPQGAKERNDRLLDELLIKPGLLPEENLYRMPAELGPSDGARLYDKFLSGVPPFDLVLLGVGEDGHTASLFSVKSDAQGQHALPVFDAPKQPKTRISMSFSRLRDAKARWALLFGAEKRKISVDIEQGKHFPIRQVDPTCFFVGMS